MFLFVLFSFFYWFHEGVHSFVVVSRPKIQSCLNAETECLKFQASFCARSDPIKCDTRTNFCSFFKSKLCQYHFLSGGGSSEIEAVALTRDLETLWKEACEYSYGKNSLPSAGDTVVASQTTIGFPGLRLKNVVYSGVKLIESNGEYPQYEALLIAERKEAFGLPPVVWIFNQLTGNVERLKEKYSAAQGKAKTKILAVEVDGGFRIDFTCDLQVELEFPKLLLKILPAPKAKVEEQGSSSVRKAVGKDITKAIDDSNAAYENWKTNESSQ